MQSRYGVSEYFLWSKSKTEGRKVIRSENYFCEVYSNSNSKLKLQNCLPTSAVESRPYKFHEDVKTYQRNVRKQQAISCTVCLLEVSSLDSTVFKICSSCPYTYNLIKIVNPLLTCYYEIGYQLNLNLFYKMIILIVMQLVVYHCTCRWKLGRQTYIVIWRMPIKPWGIVPSLMLCGLPSLYESIWRLILWSEDTIQIIPNQSSSSKCSLTHWMCLFADRPIDSS